MNQLPGAPIMRTTRCFLPLAFSAAIIACDRPAPSEFDQRPDQAVHVTSIAQLKSALQNGRSWIVIDEPLYFVNSSDRIVLDSLCLPHNCAHTVTIEGGSGWDGAVFYRFGSFPEPLLVAHNTRPWEIRLKGLFFASRCVPSGSNECAFVYSGPAFHFGTMQHSIIEDVRIQNFAGLYPVRLGHNGGVRNLKVRDVALMWNQNPIRIENAFGVHWRGGHNQMPFGTGPEVNAGWPAGIEILGDATYGGPITIDDLHMEGGSLLVQGNRISFRGGYFFFTSGVWLNGTNIQAECNGVFVVDTTRPRNVPMLWVNNAARCLSEQGM